MNRATMALLGLLSGLAGCAGSQGSGGNDRFVNVALQPGPQNAGEIGQVGLVNQGGVTGLDFFFGGVPAYVTLPLQLYTYIYPGRCTALGAQPAYAMNDTVQTTKVDNGWIMSKRVPASLDSLRSSDHAVVVRTSAADRNLQIFCGDIPTAAD